MTRLLYFVKPTLKLFWTIIYSRNPHIKFTCKLEVDGHLVGRYYRKPTHTAQCLHFDSHYKLSVIRTLNHRPKSAVTDPEERNKEIYHIKDAWGRCGYPQWA